VAKHCIHKALGSIFITIKEKKKKDLAKKNQ
jgi:hypothetical protein